MNTDIAYTAVAPLRAKQKHKQTNTQEMQKSNISSAHTGESHDMQHPNARDN